MNILHITGYTVERGGTAKIVFENATFQISKGHNVTILSIDFPNEEPYPIPKGAKLVLTKNHWIGKFISNFSFETNDFLKKHGNSFDIIHIHGIWFWGSVAPFIFKNKAKKLITIHGMLSEWTMAQGKIKKWIFGKILQDTSLKEAKALIVNTEIEKNELLKYIEIEKSKIFIVPNAIEKSSPVSEKEKLDFKKRNGLQLRDKNILFLSRIHKKKGLELLIKAFSGLKNLDFNVNLLIAGPDEGFKGKVEKMIKAFGLDKRVIFLGSVSGRTKEIVFSIADVYALTSFSEGFPMAVMEAIEAGVPVVVSDQTRIDTYISKYNAGIVVKLNEEQISEALLSILENKDLANDFVKNGEEMLLKEFRPEFIYGKMIEIYESILK